MDVGKRYLVVERLGGISLIVSAGLFVLWSLLSAASGHPPALPAQIPAWISDHRLTISLADECLSFATYFLIPGAVGLGIRFWARSNHPILTILFLSCVVLAVVNLAQMNVVLGRLVYPVFGIAVGGEALAFSLSSYYGGLHMVDLVWVAASLLGGMIFFRTGHRWTPVLSLVVAVCELLVAYPWLFSPETVVLLRSPLWAWLILAGGILMRRPIPEKTPGV